MPRQLFALLGAITIGLLVPALVASAATEVGLPTWPQAFTLFPGRTLQFAFPVTQPGAVSVNLEWQGTPLAIGMQDASGSRLGSPVSRPAPRATVTFELSAAHVGRKCVWMVTLSTPASGGGRSAAPPVPGRAVPAATGSISVTAPAIDDQALQARLPAILAEREKAAEAAKQRLMAHPFKSSIDARLALLDKQQSGRLAEEAKRLVPAVDALAKQQLRALSADSGAVRARAGKSLGLQDAKWSTRLDSIRLPADRPARTGDQPPPDKPVLKSVTPAAALPGQVVTLDVSGLTGAPDTIGVTFEIQPGARASGKVIGYATDENDQVEVVVPLAGGMAQDYDGQVRVRDGDGDDSNWLPFHYNAPPRPVIDSVTLGGTSSLPGDQLIVRGSNFAPGSQVYFTAAYEMISPVAAAPWPGTTPSAAELSVAIPQHTSPQRFSAWVFVSYPYTSPYLSATITGEWFRVQLDAHQPSLAMAKPATGLPGTAVLLSGQGFGDAAGEVHFIVPPTGEDRVAVVTSWSDTGIATIVPDASGLVAATPGSVYVKLPGGQRTEAIAFTFEPATEYRLMRLKNALLAADVAFQAKEAGDTWSFRDDGTAIIATHDGSFWTSHSGADTWFSNFRLKNGWTVDTVEFNAEDISVGGGQYIILSLLGEASLVASLPGTPSPLVIAAWQTPGGSFVTPWAGYEVRVLIKGPKGVPAGD